MVLVGLHVRFVEVDEAFVVYLLPLPAHASCMLAEKKSRAAAAAEVVEAFRDALWPYQSP